MGKYYTIKALRDSGKVDNYQNHKCYLTMQDEDGVEYTDVYAAFQNIPEIGTKRFGDVLDGEYGLRFKPSQDPNAQPQQQSGTSTGSAPKNAVQGPSRGRSDNNDGMRQGMSINNAANYVANNYPELSAKDYKDRVELYARQIYSIDLTKSDEQYTKDLIESV